MNVASNKIAWSDIDNDGDSDIIVTTVALEKTIIYRNNGDGTFKKDLDWQNNPANSYAIGAAFGDYDNDGDQDLYLSLSDALYSNDGEGKFTIVPGTPFSTESSDHAVWGDYDNDGDLDLYLANGGGPRLNSLFRNDGNSVFTKLNSLLTEDASNSRSASWIDVNNDHYLDLFVGNIGQNKLFINGGGELHGLQVNLKGVQSNGSGNGARIRVKTGDTWQIREVYSQQSTSLRAHVGLGNNTKVDLVRIEWPSGNVQLTRDVNADQVLTIVESNSTENSPHQLGFSVSGQEDQVLPIWANDFVSAFKDEDGDQLNSIKILSPPDHGILQFNSLPVTAGQSIKIREMNDLKFLPAADYEGETVFQYEAIDGRSLGVNCTLALKILGVNDAPTIQSLPSTVKNLVSLGDVVSIDVAVDDIDTSADGLTLSASSNDQTISPTDKITFSGTGKTRTFHLKTIKGGTCQVTLTVSDGELQASTTFSLAINTPHSLSLNQETNEDSPLAFKRTDFTNNFIDNEGDVLNEIKIVSLPASGNLTLGTSKVSVGQVIPQADLDALAYAPLGDYNGKITFEFEATDKRVLSVNCKATITVVAVNDAPIIVPLEDIIINEIKDGEFKEIGITVTDVDNSFDAFKISASSSNESVVLTKDINIVKTNTSATVKFLTSKSGSTRITIVASDGLASSQTSFTMTLNQLVTGLENPNSIGLFLYPNPAKETLTISIPNEMTSKELKFSLVNALGQVEKTQNVRSYDGKILVDVSSISPGLYFVKIIDGYSSTYSMKLVKE